MKNMGIVGRLFADSFSRSVDPNQRNHPPGDGSRRKGRVCSPDYQGNKVKRFSGLDFFLLLLAGLRPMKSKPNTRANHGTQAENAFPSKCAGTSNLACNA